MTWAMVVLPALLLLLGPVPAGHCATPDRLPVVHRDYVTNLDFTTTTAYVAAGVTGQLPLRTFQTNIARGFSDDFIFGVYCNPIETSSGHNYHIFPDGCFVIEEFYDVGPPSVTIASGNWKLEGNTLVISDLVDRKPASALLGMKWIKERLGNPERFRVFVTASGDWIGDTILVTEDTASKGTQVGMKYVRRTAYYRDWPKKQRDLLKQ
jgi:hypothetical protein